MSSVVFFDEAWLRWWVGYLKDRKTALEIPPIDERWYSDVMHCVGVARIHPDCAGDVHKAGASIFSR